MDGERGVCSVWAWGGEGWVEVGGCKVGGWGFIREEGGGGW